VVTREGWCTLADKADTAPALQVDEDGRKLQLEAEKAKYLEAIAAVRKDSAEAQAGSLKAMLPGVTDAPKGRGQAGDKAGAFGPWWAHQLIDKIAKTVADDARTALAGTAAPRVLVVNDRSLLPGDWTAGQVRGTLARQLGRLRALDSYAGDELGQLDAAVPLYEQDEQAPGSRRRPRPGRAGGAARTRTAAWSPSARASGWLSPSRPPQSRPASPAAACPPEPWRRPSTCSACCAPTTRSPRPRSPPPPTELPNRTAGHLARTVAVEADGFGVVLSSPSTEQFAATLDARDRAAQSVSRLQARLAPVQAELTTLRARLTAVKRWATATADGKDASAVAALRTAADALVAQVASREAATGPARTLMAQAQQVLADADAALAALLNAPAGGEAPLIVAVRRKRLDARVATGRITHVLYVNLDAVAADAVTRWSILGTSGRIRFLSAGTASWLLLDTSSGAVVAGERGRRHDLRPGDGRRTGRTAAGGAANGRPGQGPADRAGELDHAAGGRARRRAVSGGRDRGAGGRPGRARLSTGGRMLADSGPLGLARPWRGLWLVVPGGSSEVAQEFAVVGEDPDVEINGEYVSS